MEYKVGDRVKIKSLDWYNENKDKDGIVEFEFHIFVPGMSKFCGKVLTVADVYTNFYGCETYSMKEDDYEWGWGVDTIEGLVEDETKLHIEKVIRDGKVAVLYSPGYGAGWSSQCWDEKNSEIPVFHPLLVEMVESGQESLINEEWMKEHFGEDLGYIYCGGVEQLEIKWLPVGTRFVIEEYEGFETINILDNIKFMIA